jgi:hypothetical protein
MQGRPDPASGRPVVYAAVDLLLSSPERERKERFEVIAVAPWQRVSEGRRERGRRDHNVTGLATERHSRGAKVHALVMGVERNWLVAGQVDAAPDPDQVGNPIDQANLGSLQQHVRVKVEVLGCRGAGDSHQSQ